MGWLSRPPAPPVCPGCGRMAVTHGSTRSGAQVARWTPDCSCAAVEQQVDVASTPTYGQVRSDALDAVLAASTAITGEWVRGTGPTRGEAADALALAQQHLVAARRALERATGRVG